MDTEAHILKTINHFQHGKKENFYPFVTEYPNGVPAYCSQPTNWSYSVSNYHVTVYVKVAQRTKYNTSSTTNVTVFSGSGTVGKGTITLTA